MSYFEVYNEKIHDLLVVKDEQNQKKMPVSKTFSGLIAIFTKNLYQNLLVSGQYFKYI